jgi:hypothetical protein
MTRGTSFRIHTRNSFRPLVALGIGLGFYLFVAEHRGNAQFTTASLGGTVVDNSGAVIPRALVSLTNEETGLTRLSSPAQTVRSWLLRFRLEPTR